MSELADEADSKSVDGNIVWVQVPLPAVFLCPEMLDYFPHLTFINSVRKMKQANPGTISVNNSD